MNMNPDAKHCNETNPELFSDFSDDYKSAYGTRPRYFITEEEVKEMYPSIRAEIEFQIAEDKRERAWEESIKDGSNEHFAKVETLTYSPFAGLTV
jgi:hypothetical protein